MDGMVGFVQAVTDADIILHGEGMIWGHELCEAAIVANKTIACKICRIPADSLTDEQIGDIVRFKEGQEPVAAHDGQKRFSARPGEMN